MFVRRVLVGRGPKHTQGPIRGGKCGGDERECVCLFGTVLTVRIDEREIDRERQRELCWSLAQKKKK